MFVGASVQVSCPASAAVNVPAELQVLKKGTLRLISFQLSLIISSWGPHQYIYSHDTFIIVKLHCDIFSVMKKIKIYDRRFVITQQTQTASVYKFNGSNHHTQIQ